VLLPEHIARIVETYQYRQELERYSRRVSLDEIARNDYNLNITRYINTTVAEKQIILSEVQTELDDWEKARLAALAKHNEFLNELGLPPLP